jgi:hypothetical protein
MEWNIITSNFAADSQRTSQHIRALAYQENMTKKELIVNVISKSWNRISFSRR